GRQTPAMELFERDEAPAIPKEVLEDQEKACVQIFERHLADPTLMPAAIVNAACDFSGDLCLTATVPFLEKMRDRRKDGGRPADALRKIGYVTDHAGVAQMVLQYGQ